MMDEEAEGALPSGAVESQPELMEGIVVSDVHTGPQASRVESLRRILQAVDLDLAQQIGTKAIGSAISTAMDQGQPAIYGLGLLDLPKRMFEAIPRFFWAYASRNDDFYKVGEVEQPIYIPVFQVLCQGGAAERFTSAIRYSSEEAREVTVDLIVKGLGVNYDSTVTETRTFSSGNIAGSFQIGIPAILTTETYRHHTNDDLTGVRSMIRSVAGTPQPIPEGDRSFAQLDGLKYGAGQYFGMKDGTPTESYKIVSQETLKATLSFPGFEDPNKFGLEARVRNDTSLEVAFELAKKGRFTRHYAKGSPLAQKFDATEVDYAD